LQFVKGVKETSVPDVKLTRARDGASGVATFVFGEPSIFEASEELGDITGLYMEDDEGVLSTVDVQVRKERGGEQAAKRLAVPTQPCLSQSIPPFSQAKFVNGKPDRIEARYSMKSAFEWDR
jgi:photosystem II protein